ncbi:MAG: radical SAM protein [Candidatus Altiarchaeota archaeon]
MVNLRYVLKVCKPRLYLRLIKTYILIAFGARPLRYVDFALDYRCNLKCEHCFATVLEKPKGARKMTLEDYRRVADECMSEGAIQFSFQGGEPLLINNLAEIIACFKPDWNLISVTTNGTLLNEDRLKYLKKAGVDILTVSLDSGIPDEHDSFRGLKGAFDKTVSGIELALKSGLKVTVGTVVSHSNLRSDGLRKLLEWAKGRKLLVTLALAVPAGRWLDNKGILLTEQDMTYVHKLSSESQFITTDIEANFISYGCGAGKEILYITPYGDVFVCPFIHIRFGNVFEESIKAIRARALRNKYLDHYHDKCLAAQDREFIEKYLSKTFGQKQLPLDYKEVFSD